MITLLIKQQKSENETHVLRVIESYNTTSRQKLIPRQTMLIRYNSVENPLGDEGSVLQNVERQLAKLSNEVTKLRTELEIETNERKRLESLLSNPLHTKRSLL